MSRIIYLNGSYVNENDAKVSVFDHGFLYGDGVFEGIRAYAGRVFKLDEHLQRLYESAKSIMLSIPESYGKMKEAILRPSAGMNCGTLIYGWLFPGAQATWARPQQMPQADNSHIASSIALYPPELYEKGMPVITVPTPQCSRCAGRAN